MAKTAETPATLKARAKVLLERAARLEQARVLKLGAHVLKHEANGFKDFDVEVFKREIAAL